MTKEEIIAMAREAGLLAGADVASDRNRLFAAGLANFAELVAVKEREACAQMCEQSDEQAHNLLKALQNEAELRQLTALQKLVANHYQGGEFGYIETQNDSQDVGDGLFTFCINEASDANDKAEFVHMLNQAIEQLRSLASELESLE